MPSKSKTKGSTFEREMAKKLNTIFETDEFSRTMGSGAFVGKSNWNKRSGLNQDVKNALASDIICPSWFPVSIECKHYEDSPIYHNLLDKGDGTLDGWLEKAIYDAKNTNTIPMVFFKTTRKGVFVAYPSSINFFLTTKISHRCVYNQFDITSFDNFETIIYEIRELCKSKDFLIKILV